MSGDVCQLVGTFFRRYNLLGSRLVVAVSGGQDSVCLLHILSTLKNELSLDFCVAHLNHMLRGEESCADAEYVAALACQMELTAEIGQVDVHSLRRERRMTLEEAAREARYRFLTQVAGKYDTDLIVTGHTQNDQVETLLLHIIRGSGLRGLVGLQPMTPRTIENRQVQIVRPMLDITREETQDYCHRHSLLTMLDHSNLDTAPMRNKIRLQLLPLLETYNPGIAEALLRLAATAGDEVAYLDDHVSQLAQRVVVRDGNVITLDKQYLSGLHPAVIRHLLRNCFEQFPGGLQDIESVHIENMLLLMPKPAGRRLALPHGLIFLTGYDCCWLGMEEDLPCPFPPLDGKHRLLIPGSTSFSDWRVEASIVQTIDKWDDNSMAAHMDMDVTGSDLWVRGWQEGDCLQPLGLDNTKKLAKFMIDARIPRMWRKKIPVVVSPSGIIWLMGYRLDERVKITAQTQRILRLEFQRI